MAKKGSASERASSEGKKEKNADVWYDGERARASPDFRSRAPRSRACVVSGD